MKAKRIRWETFIKKYRPVKNTLDKRAGCEGFLFEVRGREFEVVREAHNKNPDTVWTLLDCDGKLVVGSGMSFVNRMGYFVTEVPATGFVSVSY